MNEYIVPILMLLAAGLLTGFFSGLLGIGGGAILVLALYEVFVLMRVSGDVSMHLALGTGLAVIIPTSIRSAMSHNARGAVDWDIVSSMAFWVVAGVVLGAIVARYSSAETLKFIWVVVMPILALRFIFGTGGRRLGDDVPTGIFRSVYGVFVGTMSTLMSVGGGVFVTTLMVLCGRSIHQAVGTSSNFGPLIAVPGVLGFMWAGWGNPNLPTASLGYVSLLGAAVVIPASVAAAPLGVRAAHAIPKRKLELIFAAFLIFASIRFAISIWG